MSGVIVERRDHVLITGGRCPPARAFSTALTMPLSMNGPFLTERAIMSPFSIADCRFPQRTIDAEGLSIGDRQPPIANRPLYFVLRSFRIIFCVRLLLRV